MPNLPSAPPTDSIVAASASPTIHLSALQLHFRLDAFEGPLDLLLHLIRQRDLDIFDIPIAQIAEEFQTIAEAAQRIDLELAGDYLEMAAELAHIKSKMLLPSTKTDPHERDPRERLVEKLIEYEQIKETSRFLQNREQLGRDVFSRGSDLTETLPDLPVTTDLPASQLLDLFARVLQRKLKAAQGPFHSVRRDTISVRSRILWVCQILRRRPTISFSALVEEIFDKPTLIATFLALLELSRLQKLRLSQEDPDDIHLEALEPLDSVSFENVQTFSNLPEDSTYDPDAFEEPLALLEDGLDDDDPWDEEDDDPSSLI